MRPETRYRSSTAHRLLAAGLRGFAVRTRSAAITRPAMGVGPAQQGGSANDRHLRPTWTPVDIDRRDGQPGDPHRVAGAVLYSAESESMLRVGDRQGQVLPAERTAGGRILLAELPRQTIEQLYLSPTPIQARDATPGLEPIDDWRRASSSPSAVSSRRPGRSASRATRADGGRCGRSRCRPAQRQRAGRRALTVAMPTRALRAARRRPFVGQLKSTVRDVQVEIAHIG